MISYGAALVILRTEGKKKLLKTETVPLADISGRISAEKISAPVANPPFDNSAMDGFALRAEDIANAPVALKSAGHIAAGDKPEKFALAQRQCCEIMTGAPLPPGCDAVVPVEKTEKNDNGRILFREPAQMGDNIRRAGADFAVGDDVLDFGVLMQAGHVLTLAALGIGSAKVLRRPKAGLISTGSEVVDDLGAKLKGGQIYNSTGHYLHAALPSMGMEPVSFGTVSDDAALYKSKLMRAAEDGCDIILSTGAVSMGVHDFVPAALKEMGVEVFFHKVAVRPGKPLLFAKLPKGSFFFGLPGNPAATAACLRFFVCPLLRAMQGLPPERPEHGVLAEDYVRDKSGLRLFLRAALRDNDRGFNEIHIIREQPSFMVNPFVRSDVWAVVPEPASTLKAGDIVQFYRSVLI
ncbi:MAG: gephyrin-like molybdotransferase Glp [Pseudomonadota bacterium]